MKYYEYKPHEILRESVKCFWIHEAAYPADTRQDIAPDGCVELIFNFGSPYLLRTADEPVPLPAAIIVGFQDKTIPLLLRGTVRVVAARLFAWGALALLQDNVSALAHAMTPLGAGWKDLLQRLEALVTRGSYEKAARALEEHLIRQALVRTFDKKLIQAAAKHLMHAKGQVRVSELAEYCHMSVRQLERGFQQVVGTSPKAFARTVRFQEAERHLMFHPDADLTALAHDCGYFDQAHFIKDFKAFTGRTPTEYAEQMRRMQEILKSKDVVFLQST